MSEQQAAGTAAVQVVAGGVLFKLILFSVALGIVPLGSYFASLHYLWNGNTTFAAITAVVAANIVLAGYIATSLMEDRQAIASKEGSSAESRKNR